MAWMSNPAQLHPPRAFRLKDTYASANTSLIHVQVCRFWSCKSGQLHHPNLDQNILKSKHSQACCHPSVFIYQHLCALPISIQSTRGWEAERNSNTDMQYGTYCRVRALAVLRLQRQHYMLFGENAGAARTRTLSTFSNESNKAKQNRADDYVVMIWGDRMRGRRREKDEVRSTRRAGRQAGVLQHMQSARATCHLSKY